MSECGKKVFVTSKTINELNGMSHWNKVLPSYNVDVHKVFALPIVAYSICVHAGNNIKICWNDFTKTLSVSTGMLYYLYWIMAGSSPTVWQWWEVKLPLKTWGLSWTQACDASNSTIAPQSLAKWPVQTGHFTHFYQGQFWPSGIVVASVCVCMWGAINLSLHGQI